MKYCPKCKCEYQDTATVCGDCKLDLVDALEEAKMYQTVIATKKSELDDLLKYIKYSKIEDYKIEYLEDDAESVKILVPEEDFEKAHKYLTVYVMENMSDENKEDDFYFNEYKTEHNDIETKINDLKGTVFSFSIVGLALLIFSILSFAGVLKTPFSGNTLLLTVSAIIGVISIYVAYSSNKKAKATNDYATEKKEKIESIYKNFAAKYNPDTYLSKNEIDLEGMDDGAKYFAVFDLIKADLKNDFPNEDDLIINSVADKFYEKINK